VVPPATFTPMQFFGLLVASPLAMILTVLVGIFINNTVSKTRIDALTTEVKRTEEVLTIKIGAVDAKMDGVKDGLTTKIGGVETKVSALDTKIDKVEMALAAKIDGKVSALDTKIDKVEIALADKIDGKFNTLLSEFRRVEVVLSTKIDGQAADIRRIEGVLKAEIQRVEGVMNANMASLAARVKAVEERPVAVAAAAGGLVKTA